MNVNYRSYTLKAFSLKVNRIVSKWSVYTKYKADSLVFLLLSVHAWCSQICVVSTKNWQQIFWFFAKKPLLVLSFSFLIVLSHMWTLMDLSLEVCWVNVFRVETGHSVELFQPSVKRAVRCLNCVVIKFWVNIKLWLAPRLTESKWTHTDKPACFLFKQVSHPQTSVRLAHYSES